MEDFVPFEIAKKLEEKGFTLHKSNVVGKFDSDGVFHSQLYINFTETMDSEEIIAPTISQVLHWLREEKKIYLELIIVVDTEYTCDIYKFDVKPIECIGATDYFKTYELAALAGIEYVIDNNLI